MTTALTVAADSPSTKLATLQEQYDTLKLESKVAVLETTLRRHDMATNLLEGWGDFIDPLDSLRSEPDYFSGGAGSWSHISRPTDRADGDNAPFFRSEQELAVIRGAGEWIAQADATAVGALEILTSYVIGTEGQYDAQAKEEVAGAEQAVAVVQPVIDEFLRRCRWNVGCNSLDREIFKRWRRSGETFLQLRDMGGGYCRLRVWEPAWITEPLNAREVESFYGLPQLDWKYGVATTPGDATEVWGYYGMPNGGIVSATGERLRGEFIPATEMMHLKANVDTNVKRGMSDFFPAQVLLEKSAKVEDRVLDGGAIQASIALVRKYNPKISNQRIASAADGVVEFDTPYPIPASAGGGTRSVPTERFYSGKVVDGKGVDIECGPMGQSQAPTYLDIVDHGRGTALRTWSMHRALATGTADATTYASELSNESPFTKFGEGVQGEVETASEEMLWHIIDNACLAGRIPYEPQELRQLIDVKCTLPDIAVRNKLEDHEIRAGENQAGVLSLETWCEETGRSFEKEQARGAKPAAERLADATAKAAAQYGGAAKGQQPNARQSAFMEAVLMEAAGRAIGAVA